MSNIHVKCRRVVVECGISARALARNLLREIFMPCHLKQLEQPWRSCNKLGINTIHQLDVTHCVKANRVKAIDNRVHKSLLIIPKINATKYTVHIFSCKISQFLITIHIFSTR